MKQSKFSFADVLTALTAIAFGFGCFLGKNFYTLGNLKVSITWGATVTLLLFVTAFSAKLLKRTSRNFKTSFILQIVALVLFTVFMLFFSYSIFPHYFNVTAKKTEIQQKLDASITQAENMFPKYEAYVDKRKFDFRGRLEPIARLKGPADLAACGFDTNTSVDYNDQIDHKIDNVQATLMSSQYSNPVKKNGTKELALDWLAKAKKINDSWKATGIVKVVNEVEKNSTEWLNSLIAISRKTEGPCDNSGEFSLPDLKFADVKSYFTTIGKPAPLSILLAAGAYVFMLLSWMVTKRHSRGTGTLTNTPYEVVL